MFSFLRSDGKKNHWFIRPGKCAIADQKAVEPLSSKPTKTIPHRTAHPVPQENSPTAMDDTSPNGRNHEKMQEGLMLLLQLAPRTNNYEVWKVQVRCFCFWRAHARGNIVINC